jgi:predicted RNA-binding protein
MCLSKAFLEENGKSRLVMSDIASVSVNDGKIILMTLFGEKREVNAAIHEINFTNSRLTLTAGKSR